MKDRIKQIRKALNLTQVEFGNRLGVKGNTITNYETGLRTPSNSVILSICKEFNINEEWLRTGDGEMFSLEEDEEATYVSELLYDTKNPLYDLIKSIMKTYNQSGEKEKEIIKNFAKNLHKNLKKESRD